MAKPRKIILAEDSIADAQRATEAFSTAKIPLEVVHVEDGEKLLDLLRTEYLENIALVLLDLNMPKVGGIDVLKIMYNDDELKKLPVIIFSSSPQKEDVLDCYEYGANAYVCKPTDIDEYQKTINAISNFWGEINVLPSYNGHEVH